MCLALWIYGHVAFCMAASQIIHLVGMGGSPDELSEELVT